MGPLHQQLQLGLQVRQLNRPWTLPPAFAHVPSGDQQADAGVLRSALTGAQVDASLFEEPQVEGLSEILAGCLEREGMGR